MALGADTIEITEGSGKSIASYKFDEGGVEKAIERTALGATVTTLEASPTLSAETVIGTYPALTYVDVQGKGRISLRTTFSASNVAANIRVVFYDTADIIIGYSELLEISNLGISDGGSPARYFGTFYVLTNDPGAKSIKLYLPSAPTNSGNITTYVGVS